MAIKRLIVGKIKRPLLILYSLFAISILLNCEPKAKCSYPLNLAVGDLKMGAKLTLTVDGNSKKEFIAPYYFSLSKSQGILFEDYCNGQDSVGIKVAINEIDTIFSVKVKNIYKVYLGQNPQKDYKKFLIQFVYRRDLQGYRMNEVMFDD